MSDKSKLETICERAMVIISKTNDGDQLTPADLKLTENAVNGFLSEAGLNAFDALYQKVSAGTYVQPWLHDIEHLSVDHEGYIYWKGQEVEHYDYPYSSSSIDDLKELAERCLHIESLGMNPTTNNVIWQWDRFKDLTAKHPWLAFFKSKPGLWSDNRSLAILLTDDRAYYFVDHEVTFFHHVNEFMAFKGVEFNCEDTSYEKMTKAGFATPKAGQAENMSLAYAPLDGLIAMLEHFGVTPDLFQSEVSEVRRVH